MRGFPYVLILLLLTPPAMADDLDGGSVTLPLAEYLALVEEAEKLALAAEIEPEEPVASLVSQHTVITIDDGVAAIETVFRVELTGTPTAPVPLPLSGLAETVTLDPPGGASLDRRGGGVVLYAPEQGGYRVTVHGRRRLEDEGGADRLRLTASPAGIASLQVELPADYGWSCEGAVLVEEEERGERRFLRLAPARGTAQVLELQRRSNGGVEESLLARSTVVTVVETSGGPSPRLERRDLVHYEVLRGEIGTFELTAPFEVDRVATDEGDALPLLDQNHLRVEREERLAVGTGHLVVTARPQALREDTPLPLLEPSIAPEARYLVVTSALAADLRPLPAANWNRVDLQDLPATLRPGIAALRPSAVWRLVDAAVMPRLMARLLPPVESLGGVVWERSTTTLLTGDGSLVHRDHLTIESTASVFEIELPGDATLWSTRVDGMAVRPLERGPTVIVPLGFKSDGHSVVEVVAVEAQAIERGRSSMSFTAPAVREPVIVHEWRLLLSERHRYRVIESALEPAARPSILGRRRIPSLPAIIPGLSGMVVDEEGGALPGVTVTVRGPVDRTVISDAQGHFHMPNLPPGIYEVQAALDGFDTTTYRVTLGVQGKRIELELRLAMVAEMLTVTSEAPTISARRFRDRQRAARQREAEAVAIPTASEIDELRRGLSSGVRPLEVELPETGKFCLLAGSLPPPRVHVELEVRSGSRP